MRAFRRIFCEPWGPAREAPRVVGLRELAWRSAMLVERVVQRAADASCPPRATPAGEHPAAPAPERRRQVYASPAAAAHRTRQTPRPSRATASPRASDLSRAIPLAASPRLRVAAS